MSKNRIYIFLICFNLLSIVVLHNANATESLEPLDCDQYGYNSSQYYECEARELERQRQGMGSLPTITVTATKPDPFPSGIYYPWGGGGGGVAEIRALVIVRLFSQFNTNGVFYRHHC